MKGRDALREMLGAGKPKPPAAETPAKRMASGAVKAMNLGLQGLSDEAAAARALRETLASAEQIVEIDPGQVDVSFIIDRIPDATDPEFATLKTAIANHGQQVPILVRPNPNDPRRYQAAYGHRRLRVARELGIAVKAIVRRLSDAELVIAQGQENNERRDLSFIERALFASTLEQRQFDRDTITAALSVDKPELSRLLSVVNAIDAGIIMAIGPAPKIGRPRWLTLAGLMAHSNARAFVESTVDESRFRSADSNTRFNLVLAAAQKVESQPPPQRAILATRNGREVAFIERTRKGLRLTSQEAAFASFLERRLPDLLSEFESATDQEPRQV
jgi:ParB family chromosome partitioning protein